MVRRLIAGESSAPLGATPAAALEHPPDRCRQPQMGVRDHQRGSSQAMLLEQAEELSPEALCLADPHGDAEHFALAEGVVVLGLPHSGCRSAPQRPATPPTCSAPDGRGVAVVKADVAEPGLVQRSAQKGFHLFIEALADAA